MSIALFFEQLYDINNVRIDVENPNPTQRPVQEHLQIGQGANEESYFMKRLTKYLIIGGDFMKTAGEAILQLNLVTNGDISEILQMAF